MKYIVLGLVTLIIALIVLIFRINSRVYQQRQMEDHLQTITDLLGKKSLPYQLSVQDKYNIVDEETSSVQEEVIDDDPPDYEPPPNYEELTTSKIKRHEGNKKTLSRRFIFHLKMYYIFIYLF